MKDLHNVVRAVTGVAPVAIGTTGTGKAGKIIDTQGYGGVEFLVAVGTITATNAVISVHMMEGDVTGTMTSVAAGDMLGTLALAGVAAAATRTSGVSKNCVQRIGYRGAKRYVQIDKISSTVTAAPPIAVVALLHSPNVAATPNP